MGFYGWDLQMDKNNYCTRGRYTKDFTASVRAQSSEAKAVQSEVKVSIDKQCQYYVERFER